MRQLLAAYLAIPDANALRFTYGPHGKPELAPNPTALCFNLSHNADLTAFAFSLTGQLGIDLARVVERDRRNGGESDMWFQLANPPPGVHGISNITRVVTPDLAGWVRDWTAANYADDFVTGTLPVYIHPSWNIRSVVEVVNQGMWALDTQQLDTTNVTSVGIGDGSAAYLRFGVRPNTVGGGRITARGAVVPPGFALTVLRTK